MKLATVFLLASLASPAVALKTNKMIRLGEAEEYTPEGINDESRNLGTSKTGGSSKSKSKSGSGRKKAMPDFTKKLLEYGKNFATCEDDIHKSYDDNPTVDVEKCYFFNAGRGTGTWCLGTGGVALRGEAFWGRDLLACCHGKEYEKLYGLACGDNSPCSKDYYDVDPDFSFDDVIVIRAPPFIEGGGGGNENIFFCPFDVFDNLDNPTTVEDVTL